MSAYKTKTGHPAKGNPSQRLRDNSTTNPWNVKHPCIVTAMELALFNALRIEMDPPVVETAIAQDVVSSASWQLPFGLGALS